MRPYGGAFSFSVYSHRPLDGLPGSAWKGKCAPSFYALGTVSGVRQKRGVAEMKKDEVSAENR